jgi:hypothetical protein
VPQKQKGIKLKNAVLARSRPAKADDEGGEGKSQEDRLTEPGQGPPKEDEASGEARADDSPEARAATEEVRKRQDEERKAAYKRQEEEVASEELGFIRQADALAHASAASAERVSLKPDDGIFDRTLMLRIWRVHKDQINNAVSGLHTNVRPGENKGTPVDRKRGPRDRPSGTTHETRQDLVGVDYKPGKSKKETATLKPSAGGYRIQAATKRDEEIERSVRSLLNKICPDNLKTIVERLAGIDLHKAEELDFVIRIIFSKALAEPHYCETYADMVFKLRTCYPEFPPEHEGEKPASFTRVLLNTVQNEFESLPTSLEPTEEEKQKYTPAEIKEEMKKRKGKILANMKFIGNLFLRNLLAVKVIGQVVHDLIGIKEDNRFPEEYMIECVCELLQAIGHTLEGGSQGKMLMSQFTARLLDLKGAVLPDGKEAFSKRMQFLIQNMLELRANDWKKKLFKEQAKTKADIKKDQVKEAQQQTKGNEAMFSTQTAGMRPSYIEDIKNAKPTRAKAPEVQQKPNFDQVYVKRLFHYFADDKNPDQLDQDWRKAAPTTKEAKQGMTWLLETGFSDPPKEEDIAETLFTLVDKGTVTIEIFADALAPNLELLEDMKMDYPHADKFFHVLLSRFLIAGKLNPIVVKPLHSVAETDGEKAKFVWGLLCGAFRRVKGKEGPDAVRKALDNGDLSSLAAKAKRCSQSELQKHLKEAGAL